MYIIYKVLMLKTFLGENKLKTLPVKRNLGIGILLILND